MNAPHILIVDDDQEICKILAKILQRQQFQTQTAFTGQEGLSAFNKLDYDAVLLDMRLPDADGIDIAREMLAQKPQVPIVLITAHGTISKAVQATKNGIYDFIEKPFERDRILLTLRNALAFGQTQKQLAEIKRDTLQKYRMIGDSKKMQQVYSLIDTIAPTHSPVLILGENGVGKELVAAAIHEISPRAKAKLVKLNCSAIPDELFESELFGHTRGAFTGAHVPRRGRILDADKGTLFLDEIGDLSPAAQAKILRFLENGEVQKVGSNEIQTVDVRVIAATNKNLEDMVESGDFRRDLFYRLEVFPITVPPLRERKQDIPLFIDFFMTEFSEKNGVSKPQLSQAAEHYLCGHEWEGNVGMLRHFIERLLLIVTSDPIDNQHIKALLKSKNHSSDAPQTLKEARLEFERNYILTVLSECGNNRTEAAKVLGMDRANLYRKMLQVGIEA